MKKWFLLVPVFVLFAVALLFKLPPNEPSLPENILTSLKNSPAPSMDEENITVDAPAPGQKVSLPMTITGKARVFENQFNYRILDSEGRVVAEGTSMSDAKDSGQFGNYSIKVTSMREPLGDRGVVEVFDYSARDGAEENKVSIPVQFDKTLMKTVSLFFGKEGAAECENVLEVKRSVERVPGIARVTLEELLKGPSSIETREKYSTSINPGVMIKNLTIVSGVAYVDFDQTIEEKNGGSCRVGAIRAQITRTLTQFPTIKSVVISVNARIDDVLQP